LAQKEITDVPVILMTPQGQLLTQSLAQKLTQYDNMIIICGQYEGVDERVREYLVPKKSASVIMSSAAANWPRWLWLTPLSGCCPVFSVRRNR